MGAKLFNKIIIKYLNYIYIITFYIFLKTTKKMAKKSQGILKSWEDLLYFKKSKKFLALKFPDFFLPFFL